MGKEIRLEIANIQGSTFGGHSLSFINIAKVCWQRKLLSPVFLYIW